MHFIMISLFNANILFPPVTGKIIRLEILILHPTFIFSVCPEENRGPYFPGLPPGLE